MRAKLILITVLLLSAAALLIAYSSESAEAVNSYSNQSPSDYVSEGQIRVYDDMVVLDIDEAKWVSYEDTGSMKPVIDVGANGLEIVPKSESELGVGDIVSYQAAWNENLVVHRIVEVGSDAFGTYYILKGDNNTGQDSGKVRFSQIKYKTIAIIY
ncbi:MAG: hypothetical protein AABY09_05635 [Nanoarchaeota archaeon]